MNGPGQYSDLVSRFQGAVRRALPPDATVVVVSKGDHELLDLGKRRAWHFPQRNDGAYAGYYPADSAAAIAHLEGLRDRGADFIAFPSTALWWLEHYGAFKQHLERRYQAVLSDGDTCMIYSLVGSDEARAPASDDRAASGAGDGGPRPGGSPNAGRRVRELAGPGVVDDLRFVFDESHYGEQAGIEFRSRADALLHYLESGHREGLEPHPLFDTSWYLRAHPEVELAGINPLLHFLQHGAEPGHDPSPYFDTEHYRSQDESLRASGVNALVHYAKNPRGGNSLHPNPLFHNRYYLNRYPDARGATSTPLGHLVQDGWREGRLASSVHASIVRNLRNASRASLMRGNWRRGTVLLFGRGEQRDGAPDLFRLAARIGADYHLNTLVVALRRPAGRDQPEGEPALFLEDYELACEIFRPAALRLLAKLLSAMNPIWAISELPEALEPLSSDHSALYLLLDAGADLRSQPRLVEDLKHATRVIVSSSSVFHAAADALGQHPTNFALAADRAPSPSRPEGNGGPASRAEPGWTDAYARSLIDLARRDADIARNRVALAAGRNSGPGRKITIPCSDWGVSGVNAALERVGTELLARGWEVEILFTRDRRWISESVPDEAHLPAIPYRFLDRDRPGLDGMWEALIADLELSGPCILFMAYDFLANSVAPALTERVGVVSWVQADDGDYHEQAYRLGPYCNAIVCVSESLRGKVAALNPSIGAKAQVIHNSSVSGSDILARRPKRTSTIRIMYSGRLVHYQKRVLDFVALAQALDRVEAPYTISLVGSFAQRDPTRERFERMAAAHLKDGRISLPGRMSRAGIFAELGRHDFFALLSDFEGFPVAMVEAMAQGCVPVVAESESGIPELVTSGRNGVIVSGRDYDEWAALLVELWGDKAQLARMSQAARASVRSELTIERIADEFDELFTRVADELAGDTYARPPCLNWGGERSPTGDVLPPPSVYRPAAVEVGGLR